MLTGIAIDLIRRVDKRHRSTPAQIAKWREIRGYLDDQLHDLEQVGEVVSIVTVNRNQRKICCYGQWIKADRLFARLYPTIGETAITYPPFWRLTSWKTGHFVRLDEFEPRSEDWRWVALINVEIASFELAIPFPRLPQVA